jgi:hypothetical protein
MVNRGGCRGGRAGKTEPPTIQASVRDILCPLEMISLRPVVLEGKLCRNTVKSILHVYRSILNDQRREVEFIQ